MEVAIMTLTQITYFEAVCEYKNVTKAASALYVSRTAVSRALKDMENEWGLVLFKRSRTGVKLTEDGERVRKMFVEFNKAYMELKKSINDSRRSQKAPELRIGITTTTGSRFFPEFFCEFRRRYPEIRLLLTERPAIESVSSVLERNSDFFITPHIVNETIYKDILERLPLYETELVLCSSLSHPLTQRDHVTLADLETTDRASLLTPLSIGTTDDQFNLIANGNEEKEMILQTSQQDLLHKAIAGGFANIVISREIAENWKDVALTSFTPPIKVNVQMIWEKRDDYSEAQRIFQQYTRENLHLLTRG